MREEIGVEYFSHERAEIAPLLPATASRVLEIGCGAGATLAWLKKTRYPDAHTTGVEGFPSMEAILRRNADEVLIANLEQPLPPLGRYDLILALDVLEHLSQPQAVLDALVERLAPGGSVIVSVPNVAHVAVAADLLFRRRFRYVEEGILDATHLRFFTEESALALMRNAGLRVERGVINGLHARRYRWVDNLTLGLFRHSFVSQYVMLGQVGPAGPARPDWRRSLGRKA